MKAGNSERTVILIFLIFTLVFVPASWPRTQQEPPLTESETQPEEEMLPEEAQQQEWSKTFQQAETQFNSADQGSSIPAFQNLIAQITEAKIKRGLTEPEQLLLWKSLDYLGQGLYNDGRLDEAEQVFLKLTELNPNYNLNEDTVSPKIIDFVKKIKTKNLGMLSISSEPTGAKLKLDGTDIGITDLTIYSLKGDHDLEVSKPGFVPQKQTISVSAQKTEKLHFKLERTSSVGFFITYPKGVEVLLNGKRIGITGGDAAERSAQTATQMNLPPADFSAEFNIPDLQIGEYEVEFRKPCWETQRRKITIDKNDDYLFEPILLSPSYSYLNITADDDKANIFIDNEYIGIAPKQNLKVCSGKHLVKLKGPRGKYEKQVETRKDESLAIAAQLNPSLTFLGLLSDPDIQKTDLDKLKTEINSRLGSLKNLNFIDSSNVPDRSALDEQLRAILEGINTNKPDKDRRAAIQEICNKVESDLLLFGFVPKERLQRTARLYFLSNWSSMADMRVIQVFEESDWTTLLGQLEYEEPLFQKRMGAQLIDTEIGSFPIVSRAVLNTSVQGSGPLAPGDILKAIGGKSVKNVAEAQSILKQLRKEEQINVTVERASVDSEVSIRLMESPMEIDFSNPALLYNRQLVAFKKVFNISINPLEKNVALLNMGLCHMHFGEFEAAFEELKQTQFSRAVGIGQGTVQYRLAQCYRELGYRKEAMESLTEAAKSLQNTIVSDDGPALTREVQRAQAALQ
jgi:tetratricopeptide (TPR) repeat protein